MLLAQKPSCQGPCTGLSWEGTWPGCLESVSRRRGSCKPYVTCCVPSVLGPWTQPPVCSHLALGL